jgi:hypothetical protein
MATSDSPQWRKLMALASGLQMTRDERIEFAQYLLRRDITSWKQLTDEQVTRLLDAFEGHYLLNELLAQRV